MRYAGLVALVSALFAADAAAQGIVMERIIIERPRPPTPMPPPTATRVSLQSHAVAITIDDQAAVTEVKQTFYNPNRWPVEGVYLFPLPDGASVSGFSMKMAGKDVPGEVLDRRRATRIYRSIVERRDDPGLLEYVGRRLIRARIFPIPALGTTDVSLRYEQILEPVGGMLEMVYPLRSQTFSRALVRQSGSIEVKAQAGVRTLFSPTHRLDVVRRGPNHVIASFEEMRSPGDRDLRVLYGLGDGTLGLSLATHKGAGEAGTFLMLISPPDASRDGDVLPRDVVFVVDTSGSMGDRGGTKMTQAKAALGYALGRLDPKDRFNVVAFATGVRRFRKGPVAATKENVAAALGFVQELQATGGTAIHDALVAALELEPAPGRVPLVFFLTDGQPTIGPSDIGTIRRATADANGAQARLFVFGVGDDVNVELLGDLAARHRGADHYVAEGEDIELKVSALYDKVAAPVLTDVTVTVDGLGEYDLFPRTIGDLFRGQQVAIIGRYRATGPRAVTLTGRIGDRTVRHVYEATFGAAADRPYLPRLWAVRKVGFLMDEIGTHGEKRELVDEIRRLGTRFGIVTPYTSFLVVEETEELQRRVRRARELASRRGRGDRPAPEGPAVAGAIRERLGILRDEEEDARMGGEAFEGRLQSGAAAIAGKKKAVGYRRAQNEGDFRTVGVKTVGAKTFRLAAGVWIDSALDAFRAKHPDAPVRRVTYRSEAWWALLGDPGAARFLSVGERVRFVAGGTVYEIEAP